MKKLELPTFRESDHTYWLEGKRLPSVTEILREAGMIDSTYFTEESCQRGIAVHRAIDMISDGTLDYKSLDYRVEPFVSAYNQFLAYSYATVVHHERLVHSRRFGFAGTLDQYVYINDRPALIDVKTGGIPAWVGAQLAAYRVAGVECRVIKPRARRFALELRQDRTFRLIEQTGDDWPVFAEALKTWREQHGNENRDASGRGREYVAVRPGANAGDQDAG